jgi:hypothetical protein
LDEVNTFASQYGIESLRDEFLKVQARTARVQDFRKRIEDVAQRVDSIVQCAYPDLSLERVFAAIRANFAPVIISGVRLLVDSVPAIAELTVRSPSLTHTMRS